MSIGIEVIQLLHHTNLVWSFDPRNNDTRWQEYVLLKTGEEAAIDRRCGRTWTLWDGREVNSADILRITDRGDWGYD